jgi:hypothetical protein
LFLLLAALLMGVCFYMPVQDSTAPKDSYRLISTECSFSVYFEGSIECAYLQLPEPNQKNLLPVTVFILVAAQARVSGSTRNQYITGWGGTSLLVLSGI